MDFIEHLGVSQKRAEAGISAKQDRPPAIFSSGIIGRVGIAENSPTERNKYRWARLRLSQSWLY
jgi:hypothetical protein